MSRPPVSCRPRWGGSSANCHVLLMAAAVADFGPAHAEPGKLEREGAGGVELEARANRGRPGRAVEAAEPTIRRSSGSRPSTAPRRSSRAREKLARKGLDAIVFNDISRAEIGFDSEAQRGGVRRAPRRASSGARAQGRGGGRDSRPRGGDAARHDRKGPQLVLSGSRRGMPGGRPASHACSLHLAWCRATRATPSTTSTAAEFRCSSPTTTRPPRCRSPRRRRWRPEKSSIREALGRAYFHCRRYAEAARRVRGRRRAVPGERLRALLPRPVARRWPASVIALAGTWRSRPTCGRSAATTPSIARGSPPSSREAPLRALVQRVLRASVAVDGREVAAIGPGLLGPARRCPR